MIAPNTLREKLDRDEPTIGTHIMFADPDVAEMVGDSGLFDYAEFVAEYATFDMSLLYHMARAAQCGGGLPLMIKPDQASQAFWAQAALGAGFKAVLFTDVRTPEDVDACHRAIAPDTPESGGFMGVKLRRPALAAYDTERYLDETKGASSFRSSYVAFVDAIATGGDDQSSELLKTFRPTASDSSPSADLFLQLHE